MLRRACNRLRRDQRGASVIELAVVAPVLSLLAMGIIDLSNGFTRRLELIEAVDRTLEKLAAQNFRIPTVVTAAATSSAPAQTDPDFSALVADTAAAAGVPASAVTVVRWLECDGVEQGSFTADCPKRSTAGCEVASPPASLNCNAIIARYVQIRVDSSFRPMFGRIVAPRADGTYPLSVEAALRIQ